jgi:membrane fusion protein (multidrug efflux system)
VPSAFTRTTRFLQQDGYRRTRVGLLIAALVLGGWAGWFFLAKVPVYETSAAARLEVKRSVHPVIARISGQVVRTRIAVGAKVKRGDILMELDAEAQARELAVLRKRRSTYWPQIRALRTEIATTAQVTKDEQVAGKLARDQTRKQVGEAEAMQEFWEAKLQRLQRLREGGHVTENDLHQTTAEAKAQRARAETLRVSIERTRSDYRTRATERQTRVDRIHHEVTALEALAATTAAEMARLEYELELRRIRSPVAGEIGEAADLRAGAVLREGDRIAVIIPEGGLQIVAEFAPAQALGRIRSGQSARMRLAGFPWIQYGTVAAHVARVSREARDGKIRIELSVDPEPRPRMRLEHGLPGSVEIEVERVSPATLALRAAGSVISKEGP